MKDILNRLLAKRGLKIEELEQEEKETFEQWNAVLSKDELTLDDIKQFCQTQCEVIEGKWRDYNLENIRKAELIAYHTVYKTLLMAIGSPKSARENLEKHLQQLLNN